MSAPSRELAWDASGNWCGEGQVLRRWKRIAVKCTCHEVKAEDCGTFICSRCKRLVPWCFGGDGTRCDDCWCQTNESGQS